MPHIILFCGSGLAYFVINLIFQTPISNYILYILDMVRFSVNVDNYGCGSGRVWVKCEGGGWLGGYQGYGGGGRLDHGGVGVCACMPVFVLPLKALYK